MTEKTTGYTPASLALAAFQPQPNMLYGLDIAAHIAGVPRRSLLVYCRAGLIQAVFQPPNGALGFTDEAIYTVRRIEHLRTIHDNDLAWINTVFELINELEYLRAELRFYRDA